MTQILIPYKYYVYENAQKIEKIGFYEDELSNVYNLCTKCLSIHDRHSKYCEACSEEFKAGDEKSYLKRFEKNQKAIDEYQKFREPQISNFQKIMAVLSQDKEDKGDKAICK